MTNFRTEVPEGTYICEVLEISTADAAKMIWRLKIVEGQYQSYEIEKKFHLTSRKAVVCLKNELKKLAVEAQDGMDFERKKLGLIGKHIIIEADINDHGFHVYYIKGFAAAVEKNKQEMAAIGW